jgi:Chitin binding Peritrophin-A domain
MMSNNINLNQFANALLSAGHSQSHNGAISNSINNSGGGPDTSVACDSGKLGLFADTGKNCRTYFFCSPGGTKYEFQCPPHLLFSDRMKTCDSPENVVCDTPAPSFTGSNSNQVVNGFAVNSPSRGLGFAGVVSAPDEAMPLRFPFHTMNHLNNNNNNNNNNMYAMQSAKRQQAMSGGMQPDFMQASSNAYPNYAMQQANSAHSQPQPSYNPYGTRSMGAGPTQISGKALKTTSLT